MCLTAENCQREAGHLVRGLGVCRGVGMEAGCGGEVQASGHEEQEPAGVVPGAGTALLIRLSCAVHGTQKTPSNNFYAP